MANGPGGNILANYFENRSYYINFRNGTLLTLFLCLSVCLSLSFILSL